MPRLLSVRPSHLMLAVLLTSSGCDRVLKKVFEADPIDPSTAPVAEVAPVAPAAPGVPSIEPAPVPADTWLDFSSEDGRFKVRFPGATEKQVQQTPTAVGPMDFVMQSATLGNAYFAVAYSDTPTELLPQFNVEAGLDGARNGAINNIGGTLISEQQIQFAGEPARAFKATATAEGHALVLEARIFFQLPRLYQLLVVYPAAEMAPTEKFFDSFSLIAAPTPG